MDSVIITPENKKGLKLLLNLAKRLGCKVRVFTDEDKEDYRLLKSMIEGRTDKFVSLEEVQKALRS